MRSVLKEMKISSVLLLLAGSAFLAFGLYNVHSISNVTEGGILGLTLLLEYWFGISPSFSGFVLTSAAIVSSIAVSSFQKESGLQAFPFHI